MPLDPVPAVVRNLEIKIVDYSCEDQAHLCVGEAGHVSRDLARLDGHVLSTNTVPWTDAKRLQGVDDVTVLPLLAVLKETLGGEFPGVDPVLLGVVGSPLLDFNVGLAICQLLLRGVLDG